MMSDMADKKDEKTTPKLSHISVVDRRLMDMRAVVFSFSSMDGIADAICKAYPTMFRRGVISWKYFPDGWPNITFEPLQTLENRHVIFLGSLYNRSQLIEQLSMVMVLPRQFVQSLSVVFPYFAPATMERVDEEGVLATAETTAKIISSCIPLTRSGPATLRVFDIHALPVRFYFHDNVMMRMMSAVPLLQTLCHPATTTIAFPDDGAAKRFKKAFMVKKYSIIICNKIRDGDKRVVNISEKLQFPTDTKELQSVLSEVVVIDDLAHSGGTLHECRLAISKAFAGQALNGANPRVSAYVTHAVLPNDGWKKFMPGGAFEGMHHFYCTNTVPEVATVIDGKGPFKVLDIAPTLAQDLLASITQH
jgi:phosphoribosylpyrophosphate synthetase